MADNEDPTLTSKREAFISMSMRMSLMRHLHPHCSSSVFACFTFPKHDEMYYTKSTSALLTLKPQSFPCGAPLVELASLYSSLISHIGYLQLVQRNVLPLGRRFFLPSFGNIWSDFKQQLPSLLIFRQASISVYISMVPSVGVWRCVSEVTSQGA